jgi:hypothetical protein
MVNSRHVVMAHWRRSGPGFSSRRDVSRESSFSEVAIDALNAFDYEAISPSSKSEND